MAAHPPQAPRKLFREPAQTESVQCPACGAPITLRGFGAIEQVSCSHCGSELSPADSGALQILQQHQRQRQQSVLPLYARGTLDGIESEIIGIVWRQCEVDGVVYPWQEFLLFNPYKGYRWLVYQMTDGQWSLGGALAGAPKAQASGHKAVVFKKERFKHFQTSVAHVSYVEGEFPWQVRHGDHAIAHDYVAPPVGISIEEQTTEEGGADVNFTQMQYISAADVWKAFGAPGSPPRTSGVGNLQPNPWKKGAALLWATFAIMIVVWIGACWMYLQARDNQVVFEKNDLGLQPFSQEIEVGEKGETTTLELKFTARPLSNQWAYVDVMLVSQVSEEAIGFGATAEEWHGVSGGESWREGSNTETVTVGGVEGGKYLLQITPQAGAAAGKPAPTDLKLAVRIRRDVVLLRYMVLPLLFIIAFPIIGFMAGRVFEGRRWANSDYAPSS
ncbi:MAG: DUF4178 domain-containing protein [Deltaproteobacteria bacterium]|nr:DUF4178 domain-containing protein [Deltaproteobacteria bacterium]